MFDEVIVDTGASLDETVLTALDRSDQVLAMTMMDVASIKNTHISLQKLHQLGYRGHAVDVVLNRADSKVFLLPAQVEKAIGREITVQIPSDRIVPQSVNKGVPVVLDSPRAEVARTLMGMADRVIESHKKAVTGDVS
jgi:pilus assembly protein CpaE